MHGRALSRGWPASDRELEKISLVMMDGRAQAERLRPGLWGSQ